MSQTTIQLGNRIRRLRQARDWSQEQLAEYADLSLSYIALLEKGRKSATVDTSAKLAHAFGITLAELFTFSGVPPQADPKDAQMMDILHNNRTAVGHRASKRRFSVCRQPPAYSAKRFFHWPYWLFRP